MSFQVDSLFTIYQRMRGSSRRRMYYNDDTKIKDSNGRLWVLTITTIAAMMTVEEV
jgi:hypothetical protein